jgi:hypothetical protein
VPDGQYVPAFNQGGLAAQWSVCTSHQSGRTPRPMTDMHRPSTRDVSLPNGRYRPLIREVSPPNRRYVKAIDQGGLPALQPVYTSHQGGRSHCLMAGMYRPLIREAAIQLYQGAAVLL